MIAFLLYSFLYVTTRVVGDRGSTALVLVDKEEEKDNKVESVEDELILKSVEDEVIIEEPSSFFLQPEDELWVKLNPEYDDEESEYFRKPGEALLHFDPKTDVGGLGFKFCFEVTGVLEDGEDGENHLQCSSDVPKIQFRLGDLRKGVYSITARIQEVGSDTVVREETRTIIVRPPIRLNPTYEWTKIPSRFHSIPPGLEIEMDVYTGQGSWVRIPPSWSLRVFIPKVQRPSLTEEGKFDEVSFKMFYKDVERNTKVGEVIQDVEGHIGVGAGCVSFKDSSSGETLEPGLTVEEVDWFNYRFAYIPSISESCSLNVCAPGVYSDSSSCLESVYE